MNVDQLIRPQAPVRRGSEFEPAHYFCTCCKVVSLGSFHPFDPHCKNDLCGSKWFNKPVVELHFGGGK